MHAFYRGPYRTAVADDEMLVEIRIPLRDDSGSAYEKVDRRVGDWAVAAAGAALTLSDGVISQARVALVAVGADLTSARPRRAPRRAAVRRAVRAGRPWPRGRLRAVTDQRGSVDYKRHVAGVLDERALGRARRASRRGGGVMQVTVSVNDHEYTREVEPRMLLVHFLRDELRLTGTHWGCDTSNCGTCVVLMDGEPLKSCTLLAATAAGHEIRTVEGLELDGVLDPVQQGFTGARPAVRFLHVRDDDDRPRAARPQSRPDRRGDPRGDLGPDLPLHRLCDDRSLDPLGGRAPDRREGDEHVRSKEVCR